MGTSDSRECTRLRAAIAHLLSEKYSFTSRSGTRHTVSAWDSTSLLCSRLIKRFTIDPSNTIFAPRISLIERLRWVLHGYR